MATDGRPLDGATDATKGDTMMASEPKLHDATTALLDAARHALARLELEVREGRIDPADYTITMGKLRDAIAKAEGKGE